ncbi:ABC transporter permease [Mangrovibrevibacter kandeliae]|uniref:ABC transporter permease n=1 Tax=Mangrovibrevibacter kandeliae TaxID=2968473 RepID=UPI002118DC3E|nr:ABC transporter permease [Aurantimonas sp. CSK15Z-1]MCQ8784167.1 ABC transporter permease [Aurantimonas sp. CSK15Z-1]MCQ8784272.1 ABC transporter permease [Aurantimonas sp. CSK15Z-1]
MSALAAGLKGFAGRYGPGVALFVGIAVTVWVVLLITLPQLAMIDISLRGSGALHGGTGAGHTLSNYAYFLFGPNGQGNLFDVAILLRTIVAAVAVTLIDVVICYPVAYILAHVASGVGARLMVLGLIVPFWINEILRAFAFRIIFGSTGLINGLGTSLGFLAHPVDFIGADVALYSSLAYSYILLMIFPIYNAVEALDRNQIEAARDMGASWPRIHWRIVLPVAKPGIASGATIVFMLTAGALAAPQILGGPSSLWFTQLVYQWFNEAGNWPRGAAYATVLLVTCLGFVLLMMKVFRVPIGAIGR